MTFLDAQIGRLLDKIDELKLWRNLTIVLTSDHGMHNGKRRELLSDQFGYVLRFYHL